MDTFSLRDLGEWGLLATECGVRANAIPCRCCELWTLTDPVDGSYEVCFVCGCKDDPVQNADPAFAGGANAVCLREARRNLIRFGYVDEVAGRSRRVPVARATTQPLLMLDLPGKCI